MVYKQSLISNSTTLEANRVTTEHLWNLGFDAVIANPIMGLDSSKTL